MSYTRSYAQERCINYNYGIAGIGLNADFCAAGEAGIILATGIRVEENSEPRRGEVFGSVTPFANMSMSASANLNVVAARGGPGGSNDRHGFGLRRMGDRSRRCRANARHRGLALRVLPGRVRSLALSDGASKFGDHFRTSPAVRGPCTNPGGIRHTLWAL